MERNRGVHRGGANWDDVLRMCETIDGNGNMIETKWNKGANARATMKSIKDYGEAVAVNTYS